jgi:hypothetical protein
MEPIGHNQLWLIVDNLTFDFPSLKEKLLSNKIGIGVGVTQMEEYGMEMMGH